jgi:hypothetical protein
MVCRFVSVFGWVAGFEDVDLGAGDAAAVDGFDAETGVEVEGSYGVVKDFSGNASVEESAEKHVSSDAGEAVEIGDAHGSPFKGCGVVSEKQVLRLHPSEQKTLAGNPACAQDDKLRSSG